MLIESISMTIAYGMILLISSCFKQINSMHNVQFHWFCTKIVGRMLLKDKSTKTSSFQPNQRVFISTKPVSLHFNQTSEPYCKIKRDQWSCQRSWNEIEEKSLECLFVFQEIGEASTGRLGWSKMGQEGEGVSKKPKLVRWPFLRLEDALSWPAPLPRIGGVP